MVDRVLWFPSLNYNNAPPKARSASLLSPLVQHFRLRLLFAMTTYYVCRGRMFVALRSQRPYTCVSSGPNIRILVSSDLGCRENTSSDSKFNASRRPSERRVLGPLDSSLAESDPTAQLKHYRITGHVEAHRAASA